MTVLREREWPRSSRAEGEGASHVVVLGEDAAEVSPHATALAALEAARAQGPGAAVWRARDLAELGEGGAVAEIVEG